MKNKIGIGESKKLTLVNKSAKVNFWYENNDKHFVNVKTNSDKTSCWILESQLDDYFKYYLDKSYKIKD